VMIGNSDGFFCQHGDETLVFLRKRRRQEQIYMCKKKNEVRNIRQKKKKKANMNV
jgi:hypothetical protein